MESTNTVAAPGGYYLDGVGDSSNGYVDTWVTEHNGCAYQGGAYQTLEVKRHCVLNCSCDDFRFSPVHFADSGKHCEHTIRLQTLILEQESEDEEIWTDDEFKLMVIGDTQSDLHDRLRVLKELGFSWPSDNENPSVSADGRYRCRVAFEGTR